MNRPVINEAPASHIEPTAAPPSRSLSLVSGGPLAKPRTVTLLAVLVLALVATLVGPLGRVPSARAYDNNPLFRVGADDGSDYVTFINGIREAFGDTASTSVPGAGGFRVNHTRPTATGYYQVDIQMWGSTNYVRLQFRLADMYLLGWWDRRNDYHFMGNRTVAKTDQEAIRSEGNVPRPPRSTIRTPFREDYGSLEAAARETRAEMLFSRDSINSAAWYLFDSDNTQNMARGALRMAQFVSEAARFRPVRDDIAMVMSGGDVLRLPTDLARQENSWGRLSDRFNWLLSQRQGFRDPNPLTGYRRNAATGVAVRIILYTAVQYAQYILGTAKGR